MIRAFGYPRRLKTPYDSTSFRRGKPWLQMHFFGWPLDELSVLTVVANVFAHAD